MCRYGGRLPRPLRLHPALRRGHCGRVCAGCRPILGLRGAACWLRRLDRLRGWRALRHGRNGRGVRSRHDRRWRPNFRCRNLQSRCGVCRGPPLGHRRACRQRGGIPRRGRHCRRYDLRRHEPCRLRHLRDGLRLRLCCLLRGRVPLLHRVLFARRLSLGRVANRGVHRKRGLRSRLGLSRRWNNGIRNDRRFGHDIGSRLLVLGRRSFSVPLFRRRRGFIGRRRINGIGIQASLQNRSLQRQRSRFSIRLRHVRERGNQCHEVRTCRRRGAIGTNIGLGLQGARRRIGRQASQQHGSPSASPMRQQAHPCRTAANSGPRQTSGIPRAGPRASRRRPRTRQMLPGETCRDRQKKSDKLAVPADEMERKRWHAFC